MPPIKQPASGQQTQASTTAPNQPPSDFERLLTKDHRMEYVPFGASDKIRLSVSIVTNLICVPTKSGKRCSENDALKFMAMCQAKRLNPFESDCFLLGYDTQNGPQFSLITAHQAYLKRAEIHPEFDGMKSGIIVEEKPEEEGARGKLVEIEGDFYTPGEQRVVGGWAEVFFKGRKVSMKKRVRLERFNKGFGVWKDDAAGMICKVAECDSLRSSFPTMLGGLYMREEVDMPNTVKPDFKPADMLKGTAPALFNNPLPQQVNPEPVTPSAPESMEKTPVDDIKAKLAGKGVSELQLLEHLINVGSASDDAANLDAVFESSPELVPMLLANFDQVIAEVRASK